MGKTELVEIFANEEGERKIRMIIWEIPTGGEEIGMKGS